MNYCKNVAIFLLFTTGLVYSSEGGSYGVTREATPEGMFVRYSYGQFDIGRLDDRSSPVLGGLVLADEASLPYANACTGMAAAAVVALARVFVQPGVDITRASDEQFADFFRRTLTLGTFLYDRWAGDDRGYLDFNDTLPILSQYVDPSVVAYKINTSGDSRLDQADQKFAEDYYSVDSSVDSLGNFYKNGLPAFADLLVARTRYAHIPAAAVLLTFGDYSRAIMYVAPRPGVSGAFLLYDSHGAYSGIPDDPMPSDEIMQDEQARERYYSATPRALRGSFLGIVPVKTADDGAISDSIRQLVAMARKDGRNWSVDGGYTALPFILDVVVQPASAPSRAPRAQASVGELFEAAERDLFSEDKLSALISGISRLSEGRTVDQKHLDAYQARLARLFERIEKQKSEHARPVREKAGSAGAPRPEARQAAPPLPAPVSRELSVDDRVRIMNLRNEQTALRSASLSPKKRTEVNIRIADIDAEIARIIAQQAK